MWVQYDCTQKSKESLCAQDERDEQPQYANTHTYTHIMHMHMVLVSLGLVYREEVKKVEVKVFLEVNLSVCVWLCWVFLVAHQLSLVMANRLVVVVHKLLIVVVSPEHSL